jgi:GTPase
VVAAARAAASEPARSYVIHRPVAEGVEVTRRDDGSFVVGGRPALRAVALSDLTEDDALDYVQNRLRRLGVERALVRAGIRDGDVVHLGALSFTYRRDEGIDAAVERAAPENGRARRGGRAAP